MSSQEDENSSNSDCNMDGDEREDEEGSSIDEEDGEESDDLQVGGWDFSSEVEKGQAVRNQKELWSRLCECRIKLQKLMVLSNKLPQYNTWEQFCEESLANDFCKGYSSVKTLFDTLLVLQCKLLKNNTETSTLQTTVDAYQSKSQVSKGTNGSQKQKLRKFKSETASCEEVLDTIHKGLLPYRDAVIQKWDDKTKLSTGHASQKAFNAFGQSSVQQINQVLQDKERLLKRTRNKRSVYKILGSTMKGEDEEMDESEEKLNKAGKILDEEIFDDDDFYHQFVKDIIETKSVGMDPMFHKKHMEIQSTRRKLKGKVDTKASKGRKLRFTVHPKLVNFMSPIVTSSDEGRSELLRSLFGQRISLPVPETDE